MFKSKSLMLVTALVTIVILVSGCSSTNSKESSSNASSDIEKSRVLVVYYSLSGNTKLLAEKIHEVTGGDIYEIELKSPYPKSLSEADKRSKEERSSGQLPELKKDNLDLRAYDLVLFGGPVWSDTLATPLESFIQTKELSKLRIAPFYTYANNKGNYEEHFQRLLSNHDIENSLGVSSSEMSDDQKITEHVREWFKTLNTVSRNSLKMKNSNSNQIEIRTGNTVIEAELNNSTGAQKFKEQLPQTISMQRIGDHEYYGRLEENLAPSENLQTGYSIGDLAFWTPGNLFALYFAEPDTDPEGLMILGKVTSTIGQVERLDNNVDIEIRLVK
ncbi:MAG: cyclophilin-like fold protein [Enterococcus sp.]